jgi:hypothetical protein
MMGQYLSGMDDACRKTPNSCTACQIYKVLSLSWICFLAAICPRNIVDGLDKASVTTSNDACNDACRRMQSL